MDTSRIRFHCATTGTQCIFLALEIYLLEALRLDIQFFKKVIRLFILTVSSWLSFSVCGFRGIGPFLLSFQISGYKVVHSVPLLTFQFLWNIWYCLFFHASTLEIYTFNNIVHCLHAFW